MNIMQVGNFMENEEIEKLISEEIARQKEEDSKDIEHKDKYTDEQYREFAIDNLVGNNIIFLKREIKTQEEARQHAIDWQNWMSEQSMSYGELAEWQGYFKTLAEKFDLVEEFEENGIL